MIGPCSNWRRGMVGGLEPWFRHTHYIPKPKNKKKRKERRSSVMSSKIVAFLFCYCKRFTLSM